MKAPGRHRLAIGGAAAVISALLLAGAPAGASGVTAAGAPIPNTNCGPEQYPTATHASQYQIPVTARAEGGEFSVGGTHGGFLQLGTGNTLSFDLCGLVALPAQTGSIAASPRYGAPGNNFSDQYNNNVKFHVPIPVAIALPGIPIPLLQGYGSANGQVSARIRLTPATNGGLDVDLYGSAKSTAAFGGLPGLLPPGPAECTVAIGDVVADGLPPSDLASLGPPPPGTSYTGPASLVHFTTTTSHFPGALFGLTGQPVTGPITDGRSVVVSDDFPVAPISPFMPPVPNALNASSPPSTLCSPAAAAALNTLIGLPSPAGNNWFSAPTAFAVNVCGERDPSTHKPLVPACNPTPFG